MSEEEIIEKIEKIIKHFEYKEYTFNGTKVDKAIQGLLDLYNKEKEKNKELLYKYKKNGRVLFSEDAIKERYINKDKIREKIEYVLEDITGEGEEAEYGARCLARKILELLEGDNNEHSKDNRKESR